MSVQLYRWNCSGDWGLQILPLRAACWPALLHVLWYYFNTYLCYLCNSQSILLGYLTVAPISSKLPFWKHMNLKSDKEGSSDTCEPFTRFLISRSITSFMLLNTKVGLLLLLKICRFKVTKYSIKLSSPISVQVLPSMMCSRLASPSVVNCFLLLHAVVSDTHHVLGWWWFIHIIKKIRWGNKINLDCSCYVLSSPMSHP